VDRRWTFGTEPDATMPIGGNIACRPVLRTATGERAESAPDAALGRAVHTNAFLRRHQDDRCAPQARIHRESETCPATTAADGLGSDIPQAASFNAGAWPSHLPIPPAQRCHHAAQPGLVERHHIHSAARWLHLPGRRHGLVQPLRAQLGNFDESRCGILLLSVGPGVAARTSGNLQHRPRRSIHQRGLHRSARIRKHFDQHGRPRTRPGQCLCRTPVEDREIRGCLSQGLWRSSRCRAQSRTILPFLQWAAATSSVELSNAGSRLSRSGNKGKDAATRRFLLMSFKGMRKSIRTMEAPTRTGDASAPLSDEFPAGYSLTRCSPAELVSASPTAIDDAAWLGQLRGFFERPEEEPKNETTFTGQQSTLIGPFFCLKNGEYLTWRTDELCPPWQARKDAKSTGRDRGLLETSVNDEVR